MMVKTARLFLLAAFSIILIIILVFLAVIQWSPHSLSAAIAYSSSRGLNQGHVTYCEQLGGKSCDGSSYFNNSHVLVKVRTRKLYDLIDSFSSYGIKLKWIGIRMKGNAIHWEKTRDELVLELPQLFRSVKNILLFPGLLSEYSAYDFGANAFKGGYLGELTQWSDLIAVLYLLGHKLSIATSHRQLKEFLTHGTYDLVYTDYLGMNGVYDTGLFGLIKCKIRLLDSFGTEPVFAFKTDKFLADKSGEGFTLWNFENMKQLLTLYPHTPDNSFLGFAFVPPNTTVPHSLRKNQAVIYGKEANFYNGKGFYLTTLSSEVPLHSTVTTNDMPHGIPKNITNHGFLSLKDLTKLLQESRVFIGLGFPYEGPGALEALANGCSFIQPKFKTPLNKYNTGFFGGKPTERGYTSQVPYLEHFVGEPYVYTIDITKREEIISTIRKALKFTNFSSFLPHEFTQKGMMERIGAYINHQYFCEPPSLRMTEVTASSFEKDFQPYKAVDDFQTESTCFKSKRLIDSHWWKGDIGKEIIIERIKITLAYDWVWAKRQKICSNPYRISLLNKEGTTIVHRDYKDCRLVYDWRGLALPGVRFVKIESIGNNEKQSSQLVLCSVDVFSYKSTPHFPNWPHWSLLNTVISKSGQNCRDACIDNQMICEPDFFSLINTRTAVMNYLSCTVVHSLEEQYASYTPALAVSIDTDLTVQPGHCIISDITNLMGCSGQSTKYRRLCPCRHYVKGQITVPDLHPF